MASIKPAAIALSKSRAIGKAKSPETFLRTGPVRTFVLGIFAFVSLGRPHPPVFEPRREAAYAAARLSLKRTSDATRENVLRLIKNNCTLQTEFGEHHLEHFPEDIGATDLRVPV